MRHANDSPHPKHSTLRLLSSSSPLLFPSSDTSGRASLLDDASGRWVLPIGDSPKAPLERITLSLPVVNSATRVVLVGTGDAKKDVVKEAFTPGCTLPCARIAEGQGGARPLWLLDPPAAALLPPGAV